ncbi:MAG: hypothetical protein ACJ76Z_08640 [Thermoleophilaceae bacterium]
MAWTEERIDDAMTGIDQRFDAVERRLDRIEMRLDQLIRQQLVFGWGLAAALMAQFVAFVLTAH